MKRFVSKYSNLIEDYMKSRNNKKCTAVYSKGLTKDFKEWISTIENNRRIDFIMENSEASVK